MSDTRIVVLNLNERELNDWIGENYINCVHFGNKFALLESVNIEVKYVVNRIERTEINGAMQCFFNIDEIDDLPTVIQNELTKETL